MIARIPWARGNALPVRSGLQELRISQGQGSRFILRSELQEFILSISYIKYGILLQGLDPGYMIAGGDESRASTE